MTQPTDFAAELHIALAAAAEAAAILSARAGAERVREKGRADLVTAVDQASERAIVARLRNRFPGAGIVAEEEHGEAAGDGRRWIIDPLDGTVNYVHGHPFACVSIALVDERGPAGGVVHAPCLGEVYHAVRGGGAWLNGSPLRVSGVTAGEEGLYATGFPFKPGKGDPDEFFRLVAEVVSSSHGVRRAGAAALDLAFVAAGRVDAFFEIGLASWDVAAGMLLVTEAGGVVEGWPGDTGPPLSSGRVLASNGAVQGWLAERLARYAL